MGSEEENVKKGLGLNRRDVESGLVSSWTSYIFEQAVVSSIPSSVTATIGPRIIKLTNNTKPTTRPRPR